MSRDNSNQQPNPLRSGFFGEGEEEGGIVIHRQIGIVAAIAGWFVEAAEAVEVGDAEDVGEGTG